MNALQARIKWGLLVFVAVLLSARPAYAEETEVYFTTQAGGGQANILFMLDTSGSMAWCGATTSTCNNPDLVRMNQLKQAFSRMIDSLGGNVRVGVGRLARDSTGGGAGSNWPGGYIEYPVRGLNEPAGEMATTRSVGMSADDAYQNSSGLNTTAERFYFPNGTQNTSGGGTGFIFRDISLPRYAKITSASLELQAGGNSNNSNSLNLLAGYQIGAGLPAFSTSNDIFSRDWQGGRVLPTVGGSWSSSSTYPIDVSELVQDAVNQPGWCGGHDLALGFMNQSAQDSSVRRINTFDRDKNNNSYRAPRLVVEWEVNPGLLPGTPGQPDYETTLSCIGATTKGIEKAADDAGERGGIVHLSESALPVHDGGLAAFRFIDIPFDARTVLAAPDYVNKALLAVRGVDSWVEEFDPGGDCIRWSGGGKNRKCQAYSQPGYESVPIQSGTVTLAVRLVVGNAAAISESNNNISGRAWSSETVEVTVPAATAQFKALHQIDVTELVRESLASADWQFNGALMFSITAVDSDDRKFTLGSVDGGSANGASLSLSVSSADQGRLLPKVRDKLKDIVNGLQASGSTPLGESYAEMSRYMLGLSAEHGSRHSVAESMSGGTYISPLAAENQQCASNHIVVMTDGEPQYDNGARSSVVGITGQNLSSNHACNTVYNEGTTGASLDESFACMAELAKWNANAEGNQAGRAINTHMVAFHIQSVLPKMREVTEAGGGMTVSADNADQLENAFGSIVNSITQNSSLVAAPGVAVNTFNRFEHLDQLYYSVFRPDTRTQWAGNLKRYRLRQVREDGEVVQQIVDVSNNNAVNESSGYFSDTSRSFWSVERDGSDVRAGGAREKMPDERVLYTLLGEPAPGGSATAQSAPAGTALTRLIEATDVPSTAYGLGADAPSEQRQEAFEFLMNSWGDPMHAAPRLVNYGYTGSLEDAIRDPSKQDNTVFVSTNDGLLHAVNAQNGEEQFAFVPAGELGKTAARVANGAIIPPANKRHTWGLDSSWTIWRKAAQDGSAAEVFMYGGQRRGGRNYYALDVSSRTNPKMLWAIKGGTGDFQELGQSWSQPTLARIRIGNQPVPVLIFGGGYDVASNDGPAITSAGDDMGNAIYIVNANNGALIWKANGASVSDMKWSIPSAVSVVDVNADGFIDHLYVGDMGGQVFRVDINPENTGVNSLVSQVQVVAKLGRAESNSELAANSRRFYDAPVVSLGEHQGLPVLQIVMGSGYRAHPLSEATHERFYMLVDADVLRVHEQGFEASAPITHSDLLDVTNDVDPEPANLADKAGWYISLEHNGEKVSGDPAVFQGRVFFTTYLPTSAQSNDCVPVQGAGRLYTVSLADGSPARDNLNHGSLTPPDRYQDIASTGTGGGVNLGVFPTAVEPGDPDDDEPEDPCGSGGELAVIVGTSVHSGGRIRGCGLQKTRWFEAEDRAQAQQLIDDEVGVEAEDE